ncbi:CRISPR-associated endonuclease Cas2 [Sporanaerobium hydrogeniformans]|uniref:CRISPR-associated endonuclease Cas2 n=1 Tax=Sporanaerobium hydrogeniformans TaxID=3072179 RepID=A0AC61DF43_9FIRM|nr:CRISPR-associated endonuclease Cas2 [Sporanaerobium hydrogeniformans]PHV71530.1 CRISPR-associated endonuclease Cas2 [Sporanaerobium hydrogeniformans]
MFVLITYDVSTQSEGGKKRLRKVAKICENYGQRVQNSVFECIVDSVTLCKVKEQISKVIDAKEDSIRYYNLGNKGRTKVEHIGIESSFDVEDVLII